MKIVTLDYKFENGKFKNKNIEYILKNDKTKYLNYFLTKNADHRLNSEIIKSAQNSVELKFNKKMVEILTNINSDISNILLDLNKKRVKSIFTKVKASSKHKDHVMFDTPYTSNKSNTIKVGRFVKKLLELNDILVNEVDVEEFVTSFYAGFSLEKDFELKIVKGEEIKRLYNESNYYKNTGTLGNSCMRYYYCNSLFNLYSQNEEVSMLVLMHKKSGKITGRAILWEKTLFEYKNVNLLGDDEIKTMNKTFMDRVYTNSNKHLKMFIEYAKRNDWMWKKRQSYSYKNDFVYNDIAYKGRMTSFLTEMKREKPYLDTMAFSKGNTLNNGYNL